MKKYLLNSIKYKKPIGEMIYDKQSNHLELNIYDEYVEEFKEVFETLLQSIKRDGEFAECVINNLSVVNVSQNFVQAVQEKLIRHLNLYPEVD